MNMLHSADEGAAKPNSAPNLTQDPIPTLLRRVGIPSAVSFLIGILNNTVDVWFAGGWSVSAQAALGVAFPLFFLIIAVSGGLAQAAGALVSFRIGAKDFDGARSYIAHGLLCAIVAGLGVGGIGYFGSGWILTKMNVVGETHLYANGYLRIMFAMAAILCLVSILSGFMNAQGKTTIIRNITLIGLAANIVLNPLFMYGFGPIPEMGPIGLAWATVGANIVMCLIFVAYQLGGPYFPTSSDCWRLNFATIFAYIRQGFPPSFNLLMIGVMFFLLNSFLVRFGDAVVAGMTIGLRLEQLIILPVVGMSTAALSILGQNLGAKQPERISEAFWAALKLNMTLAFVGSIALVTFAPQLTALFSSDPDVISKGAIYLRISGSVQCAYAGFIFVTSVLQALQRPVFIAWFSLLRSAIIPGLIGVAVVTWLGKGPMEFWITLAVSNSLFAAYSVWYCIRVLKQTTQSLH